jgi:hypothetical protein
MQNEEVRMRERAEGAKERERHNLRERELVEKRE